MEEISNSLSSSRLSINVNSALEETTTDFIWKLPPGWIPVREATFVTSGNGPEGTIPIIDWKGDETARLSKIRCIFRESYQYDQYGILIRRLDA